MRIALVAPLVSTISEPFVGGAQAVVADLAQGMVRRGHEVTLFAREGSRVPDVNIEEIVVPDTVLPASFAASDQNQAPDQGFFAQSNIFFELFLQLKRSHENFDLIHAHAFDWPSFVCSTIVDAIPVLHTIHLPAVSPEINSALRVLHRQKHPLTLITVSSACAQTYEFYSPFDHVIYNGLDLEAIPFASSVSTTAPLLFAGRITPEKGVLEAIEIAELSGQQLLLAGGIYDQDFYVRRVVPRLQQAGDRAKYLGQLDHQALWNLMGQVRGLLFPIAWDEPFGLTPVEAMAAGTPVIAFERGATTEVIKDGETGFLVKPGDCAAAAAKVQLLEMIPRASCRAHAEAHFSLKHMLDAYESVYSSVI